MIPCSGLIQGFVGSAPAHDGGAADGRAFHGLARGADERWPADQPDGGFLAWVHQVIRPAPSSDDARTAGVGRPDTLNRQPGSSDAAETMPSHPAATKVPDGADAAARGYPTVAPIVFFEAAGAAPLEPAQPTGTFEPEALKHAAEWRRGDGGIRAAGDGQPPFSHSAPTAPAGDRNDPVQVRQDPVERTPATHQVETGVHQRPSSTLGQTGPDMGPDRSFAAGRFNPQPAPQLRLVVEARPPMPALQQTPPADATQTLPNPSSVEAGFGNRPATTGGGGDSHGKAGSGPNQQRVTTVSDPPRVSSAQVSFAVQGGTVEPGPSPALGTETAGPAAGAVAATSPQRQPAAPAGAAATGELSVAKALSTTVMGQIVDQAAMRSLHGRSEIRIQLKPEFLGRVQLSIATEKSRLVVRVLTDQPAVKAVIEANLDQLKTQLQRQGLTVSRFDVMLNPDAGHLPSREAFAQVFNNDAFQNGRRQPGRSDPQSQSHPDGQRSGRDRTDRDGIDYFA